MGPVIISYLIYFPIAFYIVIVVGWLLYKNGRVYILTFINESLDLVDRLNNLLLLSFYLVNIGFACLAVLFWPEISNATDAFAAAISRLGWLCLLLGILHINNKICILIYAYHNQLFHFKTDHHG